MDASVNMKMTPNEARLIREALALAADEMTDFTRDSSNGPKDRAEAREAEAQFRLLLTKI